MSDIPVIIRAEPIIAYRGWNFHDSGYLCSLNGELWEPRKALKAECRCAHAGRILAARRALTHPIDVHRCGIYCAKSYELFQQMPYTNSVVTGEVWIWGKIMFCENGYRAEYAYPKSLYVKQYSFKLTEIEPRMHKLSQYGVSVFAMIQKQEAIPIYEDGGRLVPEGAHALVNSLIGSYQKKAATKETLKLTDRVWVGSDIAIVLHISSEALTDNVTLSVSKKYCLSGHTDDITWDYGAKLWRADPKRFARRS